MEEAAKPSKSSARERFDSGKVIRILHVEDDPAHAELIRRGFAEHRLASEIHHVDNGQAALDYLQQKGEFSDPESSPTPDVVLLDLRLPGMDGLEILERIRAEEQTADLPVVILTNLSRYGVLPSGHMNSGPGFVTKSNIKLVEKYAGKYR